jgi:hypothetical protein
MLDWKGTHAMIARRSRHAARHGVLVGCVSILAATGLVAIPTVAAAGAADGRGYEMVSPADKNGGDIGADGRRTRAGADGSAVTFMSLQGFGDVQGTEVAGEYMGVRDGRPGTSGWSTHAITPRQDPMTYSAALQGTDPLYVGDMSSDLSSGVFRAWSPLTADANVADVENLYVRGDLRTPGPGTYELASGCPLCDTSGPLVLTPDGPQLPVYAGASADFSHVLFESLFNLTSDAPPQPATCVAGETFFCHARLYEADHGVVRLAGVLPDGSAADISIAGAGAGVSHPPFYTPHTISDDGRRVIFTVPVDPQNTVGHIYMRIDGSSTVQIDSSERSGSPAAAGSVYQDASADGTRVVFSSQQDLTNDAPADNSGKLYLWDAEGAVGHRLQYISLDPNGGTGLDVAPSGGEGVVGMSDDAQYVYFAAAAGDVKGLYVWHQGGSPAVRYIGALANMNRAGDADQRYLTWLSNWKIGIG